MTFPVGVPEGDVTVAVRVTVWLARAGLGDAVTVVVVGELGDRTCSFTEPELTAQVLATPPYAAAIFSVPVGKDEAATVSMATPDASVAVPSEVVAEPATDVV